MLTKKELEAMEGLVMVDFHAEWCGPCKALGPILEQVSKEENVKLIKVNVDENNELSSEYGVRGIPTVLFFKNGECKEQNVGMMPKARVLSILQTLKI